ncbi:MCE family protein [Nocardioides panacisoli]|uniref:MCE family protein n=1 Tax=Nocardioides panacisoli TaxID=627624 RepID=UPI001C62C00C|nr:MCE family protein [Nocardioides panacisoli]QYJ04867.1 MCE family protein [Nocardioides panacisoli]
MMTRLSSTLRSWRRPVAALLLGALLATSGCSILGGEDSMEIHAYLEDSAGLFEGNDVGILGVTVGSITDIEPAGEQVRVTMEVEGGHDIPEDAGAVVVARSVATDRYLELTPVHRDGPTMADGAEIPLERTRTPVDFDDALAALNDFATGIGGNKQTTRAVQRFIDVGTKALRGKGALLNDSVESLARGVNGIHSQRDGVAASLRSLDTLLAAVAEDEDVAREFVQQVTRASDLLADERDNFKRALRALNRAVTVVAEFAVANRDSIVRTLDGSTELMETVIEKEEELTEVLRVMPLGLQNLQRAEEDGRVDVVLHPAKIFPGGDLLEQLCDMLPDPVCGLIGSGS